MQQDGHADHVSTMLHQRQQFVLPGKHYAIMRFAGFGFLFVEQWRNDSMYLDKYTGHILCDFNELHGLYNDM